MSRVAIYARYSSNKQNEKSCIDQINLCQRWAANNNHDVVEIYQDDAISGASTHNRIGLTNLQEDAQHKKFDIVVCEALDRLSRDQGDLANIKKQLEFRNIKIFTLQDGEVDAMQVGIKGLMSQLYLADLAQKTRRGMEASLKEGKIPSGISYGYDCVPSQKGIFSINEHQATIVKRVFDEFISGATPRQIAKHLNDDNIPSPRNSKWNASTIGGSKSRKNGILNNHLYNGKYIWNRQHFVKDPNTGKRISRLNPESEWQTELFPQYKIIDDETFNKAKSIQL